MELVNDYNDRCIRKSCHWYMSHIPQETFVLLTDDVGNRKIAIEEKIECFSSTYRSHFTGKTNLFGLVKDYVDNLSDALQLRDKLAKADFHADDNFQDLFPPHFTPVEINQGIKSKEVLQGSYLASRDNFLEGFVNVEGYENPVSFLSCLS